MFNVNVKLLAGVEAGIVYQPAARALLQRCYLAMSFDIWERLTRLSIRTISAC